MPSKHMVKTYIRDGYYHVYNRGVEKRTIFADVQDYQVYLKYIKEALSPVSDRKNLTIEVTFIAGTFKGIPKQAKNIHGEIELLCYALMPNHFHFLLRHIDEHSLNLFLQSRCTRYSMYFNARYKRVGKLFQGHYKASLVMEEPYLLHLSRYIHRNPIETYTTFTDAFSSYPDYLGMRNTPWVNTTLIRSFFKPAEFLFLRHVNSYKNFVEHERIDSENFLGQYTLE